MGRKCVRLGAFCAAKAIVRVADQGIGAAEHVAPEVLSGRVYVVCGVVPGVGIAVSVAGVVEVAVGVLGGEEGGDGVVPAGAEGGVVAAGGVEQGSGVADD